MRILFILVFLVVFLLETQPSFSETPQEPKETVKEETIDEGIDAETLEFYKTKIGLLLYETERELVKGLRNNTTILRGGTSSEDQEETQSSIDDALKLYDANQMDKAFLAFLSIARNKNALAQELVGIMLYNGAGTEKNIDQSAKWLERAATQMRPLAMHYLGIIHFQGVDVKKNSVEAAKWLKLSLLIYDDAEAGKKRAQQDLDNLMLRLSLREQRQTQESINKWKEQNRVAFNAWKRQKQINLNRQKKLDKK